MADPNELIRAREALVAPGGVVNPSLLHAVHDGLHAVPAELPDERHEAGSADPSRLSVRRPSRF